MGALPYHTVLAQDGVFHPGALFHHRPGHNHGVGDLSPLLHHGVVAEDRIFYLAANVAALGHGTVAHIRRGRIEGGRTGGGAAVNGPALIQQVQARAGSEHIHIGIPQRVQGAHILPIALEAIGHHFFPGTEHGGDDIFAEVVGGGGVCLVMQQVRPEFFPGEDVNAHGGQVALGMGGLFLELRNGIPVIYIHNAEAACLLPGDLHNGDGAVSPGLLMTAEHPGVVHFIDMVAGEDGHIVRVIQVYEADILIDGIGGALVPPGPGIALIGGQDMYAAVHAVQLPGLAAADVAVQLQGAVLGQHTHGVDAGVGTVGQGKVDDAELPSKGDGGLGHIPGEDIETAALAPGQQHGDTFFFHG